MDRPFFLSCFPRRPRYNSCTDQLETKLSVDNIKAKENYVGRKSGNKIIVTLVEQFSVKYHYVYPNGTRMTADQEDPRSLFVRKFCRLTERQQELS